MGGQPAPHMPLQFLRQRVAGAEAIAQDHERFDDLGAFRIRHADHRRLRHRRVFHQYALHIEWTNAIARRGDQVVRAADETDRAVVLAFHRIAGEVVAITQRRCVGTVVAGEPHDRRLPQVHGEDARRARWQFVAGIVQYRHTVTGHRNAR
ncbi:hypothetical protein D3C73_920620 [compost metagenome]